MYNWGFKWKYCLSGYLLFKLGKVLLINFVLLLQLTESSNPGDYAFGGGPPSHHAPGFYDFFPGQPATHNGDGDTGINQFPAGMTASGGQVQELNHHQIMFKDHLPYPMADSN